MKRKYFISKRLAGSDEFNRNVCSEKYKLIETEGFNRREIRKYIYCPNASEEWFLFSLDASVEVNLNNINKDHWLEVSL